jgi:hypothetical protein
MFQNKSWKCLLILINVYCSKNQIVDTREEKRKTDFFKLGGLDLSWSCLDRDSQQSRKFWHFQNLFLNSQDISIEIKISRFSLDINVQTKKSWPWLRFIKIYHNSQFFLDLNQEMTWFFIYLDPVHYFWSI